MTTNGYPHERRVRNERLLIFPPRAADRIHFPDSFGQRFALFVYTQESFDWRSQATDPERVARALPEFQRLADAHGVIPTYLLNYPMALSPLVREQLVPVAESGHCIVGAQLHPRSTPPLYKGTDDRLSYAGNLGPEVERAKIESLTRAITTHYGNAPTIYRAGRYGVGSDSARFLTQFGYRMDVSVRPRFDYRSDGGPNFTRHDPRPFWAGPDATLVALPMSACFTGSLRRTGPLVYPRVAGQARLAGALAQAGMLARVALTPEDMPIADVKDAVRSMLDDGVRCLTFAVHATSFAPGYSPYVRDSADLNAFYRWWEEMFAFLATLEVRPVAADAVVAAAWSARVLHR